MPPTTDKASLDLALQIDQMCDRFEARWEAGERPRVEDFVAPLPAHLRGKLLAALLPVELELLAREGKSPTEADCRGRFPGLESVVREVFAKRQERLASGETSVSRDSVRSPRPVATTAQPHVPMTIGRFVVTRILGEGAFGTVYLAHDPRLDREVAIKVPKVDALGESFDTDRFLREAKTAASLRHSNICPVYEADVHDGRPFIVMAHVAGQPLDKLLKASKTQMPAKQAAVVTRRLALALQAAHDKGIVHRDLKPANVMLERERKDVVVMDFGLARGPKVKDARATQSGVIMGTPAYMSPEQARGEAKSVGPTADVYSLGVMLYEMLAGRRPFNGTVTEVLGQILHVEPEPPSKARPGVDANLEAICLKAMAKDTSARYASMKEFAAALDGWLRTPRGPASETAKAADTRKAADASAGTSTRQVAEVFAAMLAEQKQETAAAVGDAVRKARTPRWVFVMLALLFVGGMTTLAGIIFFTRTPTAKVTLELTDIDLADKSLSFFLDGSPIAPEKLAGEIELTVGEHVLVVNRGETVVKQLLLTVTGGREPGIKTKDITPKDPGSPSDPDRLAAEWVLSVGGNVRIADPARIPGTMQEYMELPLVGPRDQLPHTPFRLVGVGEFPRLDESNEEGLAKLNGLKHLMLLNLIDQRLTDRGLAALTDLPNLRHLNLHGTRITDTGVKQVGKFRKLEFLWIQVIPVTDDGLAELTGLTELKTLAFTSEKVTDAGLKHVAKLKKLESLGISRVPVTDDGLAALAGLPELTALELGSPKFTGTGLKHLHKSPKLNTLLLFDPSAITDEGMAALPGLTRLTWLQVGPAHTVTDAGLKHLAGMTHLGTLRVHSNSVTDDGLAHLSKLDQITELDLSGSTKLTDAGLKHLAPLFRLRVLRLNNTAVTGIGFKELAKLGQLTGLMLVDCPATDAGLANVAEIASLEQLVLERTKVTDAGLPALKKLAALKYLDLTGCATSNDARLKLKDDLPGCRIVPEPTGTSPAPKLDETGFVPIFNGKDLKGWESEWGFDKFSVDAEGNLCTAGDTPSGARWLLTKKDYSDFVLRVDFQFAKPVMSNGGVTIRSLPGLTGANRLKLEVQLRTHAILPYTGAVCYGGAAVNAVSPKDAPPLKPSGDWNLLEVEAAGPRLKISINGKLVNEVDLSKVAPGELAPKEKGTAEANLDRKAGRIGLQSLNAPMKFRNIRVKDLSGDARANPPAADPDRVAAEMILDLGGEVNLANGGHFGPRGSPKKDLPQGSYKVDRVAFYDNKNLPAELFAALGQLDGLRVAVFHRDRFPPEALAHLVGCKSLQEIALADCGLRDQDLAPLGRMTWLERVSINGNELGPATVDLLLGLKKLTFLDIGGAKIGDAEVGKLAALPLTTLALNGTAVTDKGLAALHKLSGLQALGLEGCPGVTDAGVAELQKALPNCRVKR